MAITPVMLSGDDFAAIGSVNQSGITSASRDIKKTDSNNTFDNILNAAIDMYRESDQLQKAAEEAEISFALGYTDSIHDVAAAQQKALISLQYTTKITNTVVSAYKELMNMQL